MTYCLGIINRFGIVMGADSRTNAGVDYISAYRKLFDFSQSGERVIMVCTSGNLSISQGVIHELKRDLHNQEDKNLHALTHLYVQCVVLQMTFCNPNIVWRRVICYPVDNHFHS